MAFLPYPRRPLTILPQNSQNSRKLLAEDFLPQISQMLTEISGVEEPPTDFTDAHRNFWRRRASYRFHRCPQMVRLCRVLWEDSLVAAWVWQECHTLLICAYPCNLWENILRQKFFAICGRIVMLVHVCFVGAAETAAPSCRMQKVH